MKISGNRNIEADVKKAFEILAVQKGVEQAKQDLELTDTEVLEKELNDKVVLIPTWHIGLVLPKKDALLIYNNITYRALKPHIVSNPSWTPNVTPSEYRLAPVTDAGRLFPRWNSIGLMDGANFWGLNAIVDWNGQYWLSGNATNVWEPGVSQWTVYTI